MKEYILKNEWLKLCVLNYGARIHRLQYADNLGVVTLVRGLDQLEDYLQDPFYLGACVGRFSGRICSSTLSIDNKTYTIPTENGVHLHGGDGFENKNWHLESIHTGAKPSICLSYESASGMGGYPGNLKVFVTYTLNKKALEVEFKAETDAPTLVNLTQHAYFLLDDSSSFEHYELNIPASKYIETDANLCPTGRLVATRENPLDFTLQKPIAKISLDTPFVLDTKELPITMYSPKSDMELELRTNQNVVVIYTPEHKAGICLETQNYPDSPNHSNFEDSLLLPGEIYNNRSAYLFKRKN